MPCLALRGAWGPGFPRAVTPSENSPRSIGAASGGKSTSTQWKKSTRASDEAMVRPSLLTSSPREGTSGSWHSSTRDFAPVGNPTHAKSGLRLPESLTCVTGSIAPNANSTGMTPPSAKAVVVSCMLAPLRLLPMRRDRLVEEWQAFDPALPGAKLGRQHAVGVEIGDLELAARQIADVRIESE